jgi:hypothetical protein
MDVFPFIIVQRTLAQAGSVAIGGEKNVMRFSIRISALIWPAALTGAALQIPMAATWIM